MYNFCVFAGTTEGRELVEFLSAQNVKTTASVATEYGKTLLTPSENLTISAKRLPVDQIIELFEKEKFDLVIDATHPYAESITESVSKACEQTGTRYLRLLRNVGAENEDGIFVESVEAAAEYLNNTSGNIFITTGSKELGKYVSIENFADRAYARVLPMEASLASCVSAGLQPSHIIAMQGPFTEEVNEAVMRMINAKYMVTKDGGSTGGFAEKYNAAMNLGVKMVIIGRPAQKEGLDYSGVIDLLCREYGLERKPRVSVVGIGSGKELLTVRALARIEDADCLLGTGPLLEEFAYTGKASVKAASTDEIVSCIKSDSVHSRFAVLMSFDPGMVHCTEELVKSLSDCRVEIIPGISGISWLCAKLGISYDNIPVIDIDHKESLPVLEIKRNGKVFISGTPENFRSLMEELTAAGLGSCRVSLAEDPGRTGTEFSVKTAQEISGQTFAGLKLVALVENKAVKAVITPGLPDEQFQRGEGEGGVIPMTKSEVRAVCISKLALSEDSVCWDVGAGTGSVSIEMALASVRGSVYAIEKNADAVDLIDFNKKRFSVSNLNIVAGLAPDALYDLPAPTNVFIGGSSGNMREIIQSVIDKNPDARIVATAVSMESISEIMASMNSFGFQYQEVVLLNAARSRKVAKYHMMMGQNPIHIFTMQGVKA
ncbi:MAG: precorrin-6A reductase [Eubacteriales bacterium]|nr:precorrin-6A reductase [Eubacteriales bacterium]